MDVNFQKISINGDESIYYVMFNKMLIHKDNLINNIKQVKSQNLNSKICVMLKANAYGVGDSEVVQVLEDYVDFWGVACFFEAQKIKIITKKKILIVGPLEKANIDEDFSYACSSIEDVEYLMSLNKKLNIHLKVNSGMNRYGFKNFKDFKKALTLILKSKLNIEGIFTHFATVDNYVEKQMTVFNRFVFACKNLGLKPIVHADNSFVNEKFNHHLDMVRVGFNVYHQNGEWFVPAVEIKSSLVNVVDIKRGELVGYNYQCVANKKMKVGIVPIGYADGFSCLYIGMRLKLKGVSCKVLNVCMDCFMLDITETNVKKGDEIYILNKFNSLKLYSDYSSLSQYEVMTNFSKIRAIRTVV